ncbi:MAG: tetratricopeptide repeat protein [Flavobacteriales bacterium]|nr:tetratricopeptide repeat protein [Flavobacteriales bacterium]
MKNLILFLLFIAGIPSIGFSSADDLYKQQKYDSALVAFQAELGADNYSSDLFFAIGNCYYRLGDRVHAILYYEKALKLDPDNEDLKANIAFVKRGFKDKVNTDRSGISGWYFTLVNSKGINYWSWLLIICINFGFLSLIVHRIVSDAKIRSLSFGMGIVSIAIGILCIFPASFRASSILESNQAIVLENNLDVKSEPSDNANTVFRISEGAKVNLRSENEEWVEISIDDANIGWIKKENLEKI